MPFRKLRLTQDSPAFLGPLIYHGGFLEAGAGGIAEAHLYDGTSASDEPLDAFRAAPDEHDVHAYDSGLFVLRGVFVDFGTNVEAFVLFYNLDIPEALGGPRSGA